MHPDSDVFPQWDCRRHRLRYFECGGYQHLNAQLATLRERCPPDCVIDILANKSDLPGAVPIKNAETFCAERKLPFFVTTATDYPKCQCIAQIRCGHQIELEKAF